MHSRYQLKNIFPRALVALCLLAGLIQATLFAGYGQNGYQVADNTMQSQNNRMITRPDGSSIEIEADGTKTIKTKDSLIQVKPDGTEIIKNADGTTIQRNPDGSKSIVKPDGTSIQIQADGTKVIKKANGKQIEVKPY